MSVLSGIDAEVLLAGLVGDTVLDFSAKHHLVAFHEVNHDIFEFWRTITDSIEENLLIGNDLNPNITFDEVQETSDR